MPFIKKGSPEANAKLLGAILAAKAAEIATAAAPEPKKLSTADKPAHSATGSTKGRDFDAEARGKTRCALEEAWAQSPLLPMLVKDPNDRAELHLILDEIVTERMKRVFPNG